MIYGYRVVKEEEIGIYPVDLIQISFYRNFKNGIDRMLRMVSVCRSLNLSFVIHPVGYFISDTRDHHREETMEVMCTAAKHVDSALIIHDETTQWGARLEGIYEETYKKALSELSALCHVSIENANNTPDIEWFWRQFADSITLDIGHLEAACIDSVRFVKGLEIDLIDKLHFVHIHRYNGPHSGGLMDHWSLSEGCRELEALRCLIERKQDVGVILEIDDKENLGVSLELLERIKKTKR